MSKMAELHAQIVELVENCVNYDEIIEFMVDAGYPREACRPIIDQIASDIDGEERDAEIAAEARFY